MSAEKTLNLLGLAARQRAAVSGETLYQKLSKGQIHVVLGASDAGKNTAKKLRDKCSYYDCPLYVCFTGEELSRAMGKRGRMAAGVTNAGLARAIIQSLREEDNYAEETKQRQQKQETGGEPQ